MKKRIVSLLLALMMCFSLSVTAFATENLVLSEIETHEHLYSVVNTLNRKGIEVDPYWVYLAELLIQYNEMENREEITFEDFMIQSFSVTLLNTDEYIGEYIQGRWDELTEEEQVLAKQYPTNLPIVASGKVYADGVAKNRYGRSGSGDESDAARHMSWNAFMTIELSASRAKLWADAHEAKGGNYLTLMFTCGYNGNAHTNMDKYNNQIGRNIGETLTTIDDIPEAVYEAIDDGHAYTIHDHYNCLPV